MKRPTTACSRRSTSLKERLSRRRFLVGHQLTEADWRLFPTLLRFDLAYFSLFKCNRNRIADYPSLSNYMRELYRVPGVAATVKPRYYVMNYYAIAKVNPTMVSFLKARRLISNSRTIARGLQHKTFKREENVLELYHNINSVCAQKVRIAFKEKGQEAKEHLLTLRGDQNEPAYMKLNPNGVVPTLIHDGNVDHRIVADPLLHR